MADGRKPQFRLGLLLAGLVLAALTIFMVTGGDLGGVKTVEGDHDLPPVTSPAPPPGSGTVGAR